MMREVIQKLVVLWSDFVRTFRSSRGLRGIFIFSSSRSDVANVTKVTECRRKSQKVAESRTKSHEFAPIRNCHRMSCEFVRIRAKSQKVASNVVKNRKCGMRDVTFGDTCAKRFFRAYPRRRGIG